MSKAHPRHPPSRHPPAQQAPTRPAAALPSARDLPSSRQSRPPPACPQLTAARASRADCPGARALVAAVAQATRLVMLSCEPASCSPGSRLHQDSGWRRDCHPPGIGPDYGASGQLREVAIRPPAQEHHRRPSLGCRPSDLARHHFLPPKQVPMGTEKAEMLRNSSRSGPGLPQCH